LADDSHFELATDRRKAPRFAPDVWIEFRTLAARKSPKVRAPIRDVSLRGFCFLSDVPYEPGHRLRFAVRHLFHKKSGTKTVLAGLAAVVRCEEIQTDSDAARYAIAAKIEPDRRHADPQRRLRR